MKRYWKLTAALAAFVVLFAAIGVSSQGVALSATISMTVTPTSGSTLTADGKANIYICPKPALSTCATADTTFTISVTDAAANTSTSAKQKVTVLVKNTDLATITPNTGADSNPKLITLLETGNDTGIFSHLVTSKHASTGLTGNDGSGSDLVHVKAFNGNTLEITYNPSAALGLTKTLTVDTVKPTVITTSPAASYITKGNKTVTFTVDVTDAGAGFPSKSSNVVSNNNASTKGRIQLFVGTSAVALAKTNYSAITNGFTLTASFNSNDIANIATKVPWWIEAEDLAGNLQLSSGGTTSTSTALGATPSDNSVASTVIDSAMASLPNDLFNGRKMKITISGVAQTETIVDFTGSSGTFIFGTAAADSFTVAIASGTSYTIVNTGLITVDKVAPVVASTADVQTGHTWSASKPAGSRLRTGLFASNKSIRVTFTDDSGLDPTTVTPASFIVTGNTVASVLLIDVSGENAAAPVQRIPNDVFLTLGTALTSSSRPTVSISSGIIKDKAGNSVTGKSLKSTDKLGPGLTLSKNGSLSKKEIKVAISSDEQLLANPTVVMKNLTSTTLGTLNSTATTTGTSLTQTSALGYSYKAKISGIPSGAAGAEFNIYVTATDTSSNPGKAGHSTDGTNSKAVTFELDKKLNGGANPKVSVSDKVATVIAGAVVTSGESISATAAGPKVEAVDPMIVTVDFNRRCLTAACSLSAASTATGESKEYTRDSYKTVTLTSASLKVIFKDGSSTTTTIDVVTGVNSPDGKRFTIPVLSPKVGKYQLTIKAVDLAGNDNLDASTAVTAQSLKWSWEVTAAKPVKINLAPGWNLISLPFQPANPAINSVIPTTHPADIVMTFDNASQVWLVSRRDADTGLFTGDVVVMTANTAYFVRTDNFQELSVLRPPVATAAAAPPPPPAISVVAGWNLVPVVSLTIPLPKGINADAYFGTLQSGANTGWLKAMTFSPLTRTWTSVTPKTFEAAVGTFTSSGQTFTDSCGAVTTATSAYATESVKTQVCVGKGYWLYASSSGVIIP